LKRFAVKPFLKRVVITLIRFGDKIPKFKHLAVFDQTFFEKVCGQAFLKRLAGKSTPFIELKKQLSCP